MLPKWYVEGLKERAPFPKHRIVFLAYPGVVLLDIAGPLDVFSFADFFLRSAGVTVEPVYSLEIWAREAGPVRTGAGLQILADRSYVGCLEEVDTLIVPGMAGIDLLLQDCALLQWVHSMQPPRVRRLVSVCVGAMVLAAAGCLDGRRAATHWVFCERLARDYPKVTVDPEAIFIREGGVSTSAGVTTGIDLALALVEEDWGQELASLVAKMLVMYLRRSGGQSQYSLPIAAELASRTPLRELQSWILDHLHEPLSLPGLAARAAMSERNFARVFAQECGMTPMKYVESMRLRAALRFLECSDLPIQTIALRCGFGSTERLWRACQRGLRVSPQEYRARFSKQAPLGQDEVISPPRFEHDGEKI